MLECAAQSVVITGKNGVGKTNILEAISMFTVGKGMRGAAMQEQTRLGDVKDNDATFWAVRAQVQTPNGDCQLVAAYHALKSPKRILKLEENALPRQADILQYLSVLWFLPTQAHLFHAGASEKRKYFDRIVYSFDAGHARRINAYDHYMRERGRLLKAGNYDALWVETIEAKIAQYALEVVQARLNILQILDEAMQTLEDIFPKAVLRFEGKVEQMLSQDQPEIALSQALRATRHIDARSGRCGVGAHRSQLQAIFVPTNRAAELCSTGEQKALLLSILMAQIKALQARRTLTSPPVILLLDEMVAHLDAARRAALFGLISAAKVQLFATGTDESAFATLQNAIHVRL